MGRAVDVEHVRKSSKSRYRHIVQTTWCATLSLVSPGSNWCRTAGPDAHLLSKLKEGRVVLRGDAGEKDRLYLSAIRTIVQAEVAESICRRIFAARWTEPRNFSFRKGRSNLDHQTSNDLRSLSEGGSRKHHEPDPKKETKICREIEAEIGKSLMANSLTRFLHA